MSLDLEEQKKAVLPFLQRAQEIQQADPKMAYYCRLYAIDQALKFPVRAKEINDIIKLTLGALEKDKARLELDKESDKLHCETFAVKVFDNADRKDRSGKATLNTAVAFLAASYFIEVLNQFGELDQDLLDKQRYACWRAAEIRKAIREGRPPVPAPASQSSTGSAFDTVPASEDSTTAELPTVGYNQDSTLPSVMRETGSASFQSAPSAQTRFTPGSQVLYTEGGSIEQGTVGQVLAGPDGVNRYKVALRDRLVEAAEQHLAPVVHQGQQVTLTLELGKSQPASVVVMDSVSWPPLYLLRTEDGHEHSAGPEQISLSTPHASPYAVSSPSDVHIPSMAFSQDSQHTLGQHQHNSTSHQQVSGLPASATASTPYTYPSLYSTAQPSATAAYPPATKPPAPSPPPPRAQDRPFAPAVAPAAPPASSPPSSLQQSRLPAFPTLDPNTKPSLKAITEAQKQAKHAVSALSFEDIPTAVKCLTEALKLLTSK